MYQNRRPYTVNYIPIKLKYTTKNNQLLKSNQTLIKPYTCPNLTQEIEQDTFENISYITENMFIEEEIKPHRETFEEKFNKLESQPLEYFEQNLDDLDNLNYIYNYLYHGIRFQKHLEKLESIFKDKAILAGNYHNNYYTYGDNCNEGEYISLTSVIDGYNLTYNTFVLPNISLIISPECNAIKTIYLRYEEWEQIQNRTTKQRYSYANNEYQVKKQIPLNMVKAIGLPAKYLTLTNREHLIEIYQKDILELMNKYNLDLPIVDTSNYNELLYLPENRLNHTSKRKRLIRIK